MIRLVSEAFAQLLIADWLLLRRKDRMLYDVLRKRRPSINIRSRHTPEQICRAMDIACVLYFKAVLCLQRSVATTILLRRQGLSAELVIGARVLPFKSHAWVELNGTVVNDKPYVRQLYRELERS